MDRPVGDVLRAIQDQDWADFGRLVHPYVHWTEAGVTVRGRRKVVEMLRGTGDARPATSYELRDGQVYRWNA